MSLDELNVRRCGLDEVGDCIVFLVELAVGTGARVKAVKNLGSRREPFLEPLLAEVAYLTVRGVSGVAASVDLEVAAYVSGKSLLAAERVSGSTYAEILEPTLKHARYSETAIRQGLSED